MLAGHRIGALHFIIFAFQQCQQPVECWIATQRIPLKAVFETLKPATSLASKDAFVDAEYERVEESCSEPSEPKKNVQLEGKPNGGSLKGSKSLFDVSLESDPEWSQLRIPFVDPYTSGNDDEGYYNYIDVKLAFMADLDGVKYGIAVPYDTAVALTVENLETGKVQYLSPDNNDNQELMEIMAVQLHEQFGEDLTLQRTPRILTVAGPLEEKYLKNWKTNVFPEPVPTKDLLDDSDENLDFFHNFMKEELGENEYMKTLNDDEDDDINAEFLELFGVDSSGKQNKVSTQDDRLEDFLKNVMEDEMNEETLQREMETLISSSGGKDALPSHGHEGVAVKLISYILPPSKVSEKGNPKAYSLVKPEKPYALVGKYIPASKSDGDVDLRFELLTPQQEKVIIPKLEDLFKQELKEADFNFQQPQSRSDSTKT